MKASVAFAAKFESIVGGANVRAASAQDAVAGVQPECVVSAANERELAAVLACANEAGVGVIPRGGGTKLDWGNPPKGAGIVLSTARLNQVVEHAWADLTVVVEAGCTVQTLQDTLAQHGQRLAIDALWPERATIGGILSTNDSGTLRLRYGALRDLIIGVTLALPDSTLASSGGKVVKNVAGYDLPKLATGALGTLGVITRAIFRLHPLCRDTLTLTFTASNIEEMQNAILAVQDSSLSHTALQIRCPSGHPPEADILFEATPAGLAAQKSQVEVLLRDLPLRIAAAKVWSARQQLCDSASDAGAIAKYSVLPSQIATSLRELEKIVAPADLQVNVVMQATGLGWLRVSGATAQLTKALEQFRAHLEGDGGSLAVLRLVSGGDALDAWGNPGDTIGVMRSVKRQLDPKSTLNPGRFVGGI